MRSYKIQSDIWSKSERYAMQELRSFHWKILVLIPRIYFNSLVNYD